MLEHTFTSSLSTLSSIFSAVVIYGAGTALANTKNFYQGIAVGIASSAFLAQRIAFMTLVENIPNIDCDAANGTSYGFLVVMRFAILWGLYMRATGANRSIKSPVLTILTCSAALLGALSSCVVTIQGLMSPDVPNSCSHQLNKLMTFLNNLVFVISLSILTIVVSIPIFKALAGIGRTPQHLGQLPISRVHQQARVLSRFLRLIPIALCVLLGSISILSSFIEHRFLFYASLVFSDFCSIWLLLFPLVIMAGDNGDANNSNSGSASSNGYPTSPTMLRSPAMTLSFRQGSSNNGHMSPSATLVSPYSFSDSRITSLAQNDKSSVSAPSPLHQAFILNSTRRSSPTSAGVVPYDNQTWNPTHTFFVAPENKSNELPF
ncbi:hypothetical protein QVD99_008286 [Batrachochytrium dendrobatidis]|nr:hypothetical protein O5D80_007159 [Batrachochytrium dendrobatidis]KAK5664738.1 hypothetical protein QVD99_008286 [Batrachochytrium dendrobatidis]